MKYTKHLFLFLTLFIVGCGQGEQQASNQPIETTERKPVGMVVTANPLATEAGLETLRAGGSAMDAAVTVLSTLSLVEPQSSGLGGGGFMVHYDADTKKIDYYNGRERAPMGATKELFFDENGEKLPFRQAKNSGLSIGAPGAVAVLNMAYQDHGKLPWKQLFDPTLEYAVNGFAVSPRMHNSIVSYEENFYKDPADGPTDLYEYLHLDDGSPLPIGHILVNEEYAETLRIVANNPNDFYRGDIAEKIAAAAQEMPNGGTLSTQDIADYYPVKRDAYCSKYRNTTLCGSALPSSWVSVSMVMSLLNEAPQFSAEGADDPENWTLLAEALRITYADNNQFIADDEFVEVPIQGLMSDAYIKDRAKLISREGANNNIEAGDPWAYQQQQASLLYGKDATLDDVGTTHFVIVDADGNAVSMTATVEGYFGSLRMAGGMILNNQLTDFSFDYVDADGNPIANAVAPGKRPRSSMSPTIVLDENDDFLMAVGSPGGRNIISYVAKTVVGIMSWGLSPQEAIDLPNMVARTEQVRIERNRAKPEIIQALRDFGYDVFESEGEISGLSAVLKLDDGTLQGGADPRREGTVGILFDDEVK
ncbi:gamma-glutamyltransferase [Pseudemcibacter aquimaris]|uniref:gamma-glutamyltransferase n=1 Tax=Pseudemcibacter aquimaris TaxID=2857064 RepID=UPI002013529A|nr:gamma-glutamyltransferase [Pseudemcibacter aquimaris]MCC3861217.1 gamma-glutamyltransferase [Pseudemcibacter aquimaris]WDU57992.1 gamma-glutamyltransferase [Pseudemcibacter aquimaris]